MPKSINRLYFASLTTKSMMFDFLKKKDWLKYFGFLKGKDWQKYIDKEKMIKFGIPICAVLLLFSTIQSLRFARIVGRVDQYNVGLVDEMGGFRKDIKSFGDDINEMRSFLLLPTKDYSYVTQEEQDISDDQKDASDTEVALYSFMEDFVSKQKAEESAKAVRTRMEELKKDEGLISSLKEQGLTMNDPKEDGQSLSFEILAGTESMFKVDGDLKTGGLKISDISENKTLEGADEKTLAQEIIKFAKANRGVIATIKKTVEANRTAVKDLMGREEVLNLLVQQGLHQPETPVENGDTITYPLMNREDAVMLTISIRLKDGAMMVNDEVMKTPAILKTTLLERVAKIDGATSEEKMVQEKRAELEGVLKDDAFVSMLNDLGYKVTTKPREDYNKVLYDVTDAEGKLQFSFVIELSSGMVKILKDDQEIDLLSAVGENAKKKL